MTSSKNFDIFQCSKRKKQDAHVRIINHVAVTPTTQCLLATDKRPAEAHKKVMNTELIGNCPQLPSTHTAHKQIASVKIIISKMLLPQAWDASYLFDP